MDFFATVVWAFDNETQFNRFKYSFSTVISNLKTEHIEVCEFLFIIPNDFWKEKVEKFLETLKIDIHYKIDVVDNEIIDIPLSWYLMSPWKTDSHFVIQLDNDTIVFSDIIELIKKYNEQFGIDLFHGVKANFHEYSRAHKYLAKYDKNFLLNIEKYKSNHINGGVVLINAKELRKAYSLSEFKKYIINSKNKQEKMNDEFVKFSDEAFILEFFFNQTIAYDNYDFNENLGGYPKNVFDRLKNKKGILHLITDPKFSEKKMLLINNFFTKEKNKQKLIFNDFEKFLISTKDYKNRKLMKKISKKIKRNIIKSMENFEYEK